ncbi:MAG: hypothetical protein OEY89_18485, partial [Gammaproteobacteria bacterium]|nr:hypothetical protein [Gammaproteobacteria bacterium]
METIKFQKSMYISFCSLSAAILLTACGGGGGDSGASSSTDNNDSGVPTAAISITNENSAQVVDASVDSMDTDEGATVFLAVNGPSANNQENRRSFKNLVDQIMSVKQNMPSSSSVMAAMQTDACENGGTFTYPADNETSGTLTANNCAYDGFVLNGSISFNGQEDNFGYNGSYSFRFNSFSITGLGLGDVVMNGDLNVSWQTLDNVETGSISSASLYIKTSADTIIMSNMNISYIDGVQYSEDIS